MGGARLGGEPTSARLDLRERDAELAAVGALIGDTARGGRLLVIEGPPGIGKTSLILESRKRAQEARMLVLSARGSEIEQTFSFGVVRQLFEPFLVQLPQEARAELLAGAAELATPLFEPAQLAEPAPDGASLPVLHGLYWLTANVAARQPLLVAIDDLHWCDTASLRWLAYVLPRMEGLPLLLVVGLRPAEPGEDPALLAQVLSDPLTAMMRPAPLSEAATAHLVRDTLAEDADDGFCAACHETTGGNPLLVHELLGAIAAEGLAPSAENVSRLRELAARAGWRAVSVRLSRLPDEATRLAQAVAILGDDVDPVVAAALADLDEERASKATADLVRVDVLRPEALLGFVHPLVRAAVYEALTPLEQRNGHARAARLLAESGAEPERVAAHLLLVPPARVSSDAGEGIVAVLREAARSARCRGASESAVAYLQRALAEPAHETERAGLLLELGSAEALTSGEAAVEHLRQAHDLLEEPIWRAKAALMLGRQLFFLNRDECATVFMQALQELGGADPELERVLEAGFIMNALFAPTLYPDGRRRLERVRSRPADATVADKMLLALLAYHDARANAPAVDVARLVRRALADGALLAGDVYLGPYILAAIALAMADVDDALALYDAAVAAAHRRGSISALAAAKAHRAETFVFRGDLAGAEAEGREAMAACNAWGMSATFTALVAAFISDALMEQGRLEEAGAMLARAAFDDSRSGPPRPDVFPERRARLRLLSGDLTAGLEGMLAAGRRFEAVGGLSPAYMPWRSQAALALLQLGDRDEARRLASEELALARTSGARRALGAALRVAGVVAGGAEGLGLLEESVEVLAGSPAKLEQAKARTELGAALRRANRRSLAREQLRRALELATTCGAAPLAARAESELLATGARPRRIALTGIESLTPSERRVAEMAAEGPTNREIAQALFVTAKTVEVHLSSVYRKLGISSRSQLSAALARAVGA
jgi:DNA-binding CsgD family transcriptional regulator